MKKFLRKSKKGFTLVELVVTIALMAIVASSAASLFSNIAETTKDNSYIQVAESCYNVCQMYVLEINSGFSTSSAVNESDLKFRLRYKIANGGFVYWNDEAAFSENFAEPAHDANPGLHLFFYKDTIENKTVWICPAVYYITEDREGVVYYANASGGGKK